MSKQITLMGLREQKYEFIKKNNRLPETLYINTFSLDLLADTLRMGDIHDNARNIVEDYIRTPVKEVVEGNEMGKFE